MRASLLHNGHLVGAGEASRQSLSQSPVLGRPGNKQRGAGGWGRGARERQAGARLSLIQLQGAAMTPSAVRPCVLHRPTDSVPAQWPRSSHRDRIHPPYTHTHTYTHTHRASHTPTHTHTYSHTNTHTLTRYSNTPHTPSLTLTYSSHTLIHHSDTPHIVHTHTHTLHTLTHTHTQAQSLQEHRHRKHGDLKAVLKTRHVERVGTAQSPS